MSAAPPPPPGSARTIPRAAATGSPKNRMPAYIGAGVAAIAAYYFYSAGGDPTVAKEELKHDASRMSTVIRDELPDHGKEVKPSAKEAASVLGHAISDGESRNAEGQHKLEKTKDGAGKAIMSKIDEADLKIEHEASGVKGGISSWFGGK